MGHGGTGRPPLATGFPPSLLPQVTACLREGGSLRHHNSHAQNGSSDITGETSDTIPSSCGSQRLAPVRRPALLPTGRAPAFFLFLPMRARLTPLHGLVTRPRLSLALNALTTRDSLPWVRRECKESSARAPLSNSCIVFADHRTIRPLRIHASAPVFPSSARCSASRLPLLPPQPLPVALVASPGCCHCCSSYSPIHKLKNANVPVAAARAPTNIPVAAARAAAAAAARAAAAVTPTPQQHRPGPTPQHRPPPNSSPTSTAIAEAASDAILTLASNPSPCERSITARES